MNRYAANCDRNCPCSDVWWPWIGSKIDAMLMPTWVSRMLPAAPIAQNTMPKQKPMAMPMNSSLSAIGARSAIDIPVSGRHASRSEEHTSELQSLMRISYAVFCLKKKTYNTPLNSTRQHILQCNNKYKCLNK